ncbi:protein tyrosine phosphatase 69D isoform X2 [Oratosquilla oratoria]|uniref:protein tyrosine phosphatase 69D isoform X2 n=1 Tax=Oratosquilla oratoria TaxID=337810 RepID=UPI003F75A0BB
MARQLVPVLLFYFGLVVHIYCQRVTKLSIDPSTAEKGSNVTFVCEGRGDALFWKHGHHNITNDNTHWNIETGKEEQGGGWVSTLTLVNVGLRDSGRYYCITVRSNKEKQGQRNVTLHVEAAPVLQEVQNATVKVGHKAILACTFSAAPAPEVEWINKLMKKDDKRFKLELRNESALHMSRLSIDNVTLKDNGTYMCKAHNKVGEGDVMGTAHLTIYDRPTVSLAKVRAVGSTAIQVEWGINDNNADVTQVRILIGEDPESLEPFDLDIPPDTYGAVLEGLEESKSYFVQVEVTNEIGAGLSNTSDPIAVLDKDPMFVPIPSRKGSTTDSLSLGWTKPPPELEQYIGYYVLYLENPKTGEKKETVVQAPSSDYLFTKLNPSTGYNFTIRACMDVYNDQSKDCGPFATSIIGNTMVGVPDSIADLTVKCIRDPITHSNNVQVNWKPPAESPVEKYEILLKGSAFYFNEEGQKKYDSFEKYKIVNESIRQYMFQGVKPNTNYSMKVCAASKRGCGSSMTAICSMPESVPNNQEMSRFFWWMYNKNDRIVLKLKLPRVSERNGTVCCYRVVVVKLAHGARVEDLPKPENVSFKTYEEVHESDGTGAYVAEMFSGHTMNEQYLYLGDGEVVESGSSECSVCLVGRAAARRMSRASVPRGLRRSLLSIETPPPPSDGQLSRDSNYTGFLEVTVKVEGHPQPAYSNYFTAIRPIEELPTGNYDSASATEVQVIAVAAGLFTFLLLLTIGLCVCLCFYRRKNKHLEDEVEVAESLSGSLGRIFRSLRRSHTLMSQPAIDVKPIPREELVPSYIEKLKDSELGFRREFETLPEKFYDRTSRASDMLENANKNRYPDIKAYDQTRVKLSQLNGSIGTDYINANFVMGYKERKKFICAQGPMEATVNDFWRMIVEQGCGICVMLTNLEETGKIKCVKYWPEAGDPKTFGNITVHLVKEKAHADYMVRTLRAEWGGAPHDSENDNAKEETAMTPPKHCHEVVQYHYLMWKDFIAPEHPTGVLAFIRRINQVYSQDKGPLLVHCSAGVGRTGTLVALDSLVLELEEENQASIFNFICDLRHQRNFLVQSLKQYIFIHRTLMEYAQFGNTELEEDKLREVYSNHTHHNSMEESSPLEKEFERLGKVVEDRKAFTIATSDENRPKNRYDFVLPYDSNRVILAPLPSRPTATYINASFLAGYDLAESFIVTQDPLENTVADFWRMVFDQEVNTVVMLSEFFPSTQLGSGENCCSKYWPDDEEMFEHICVKLVSSESYPKYSTRSFIVTNTKNADSINLTQFHYIGWSGHLGEVPLVTHGIVELITRVQAHTDANLSAGPPTLVHCSGGGDRSSVYVCLNNCLRQLKREGRVDVFQTCRRIRSQRQFQLQDFAQYEFCHKALVDYIDSKSLEKH